MIFDDSELEETQLMTAWSYISLCRVLTWDWQQEAFPLVDSWAGQFVK